MNESLCIDPRSVVSFQEKVIRNRLVLLDALSVEDLVPVVRKLVQRAAEGCFQAIKLVLGYALGRPGPIQVHIPSAEALSVPAAPATTVTNRHVTAAVPPTLDPELERKFHEAVTSGAFDEGRQTSVLFGKRPDSKR